MNRRCCPRYLCTLLAAVWCVSGCTRSSTPAPSAPTAAPASPDPVETARAEADAVVLDEPLHAVIGLIARGAFDEARTAAQAYLDDRPDDGRAVFLIGLAHHRQKQYALARPFMERALELEPNYHEVQHFLGWCCYYLGDPVAARRGFAAHLEHRPDEPDSHFGLGLVELESGRLDEAEAAFNRALDRIASLRERDPRRFAARAGDLVKIHVGLADVHIAQDAFGAARAHLERAISLDATRAMAWYKLGLVLRRLGDDAGADAAVARFSALEAGEVPATDPGGRE